jgi:hypothetical protein
MALVSKTIRFDPQAWEVISREAAELEIPASEFIRTAALARAVFTMSQRAPEKSGEWLELYEHVDRMWAKVGS